MDCVVSGSRPSALWQLDVVLSTFLLIDGFLALAQDLGLFKSLVVYTSVLIRSFG